MNSVSIEKINQIAIEAGQAIMEIYRSEDFGVEHKGDDSPLTKADKAAHQVIVAGLEALPSSFPILSEEGVIQDFNARKSWKTFWCVDPLDGTKEFIKRNGEFTVNIALIHENYPVLGVIYVPATNTLYFADEQGAYIRSDQKETSPLKVANNQRENPIAVGSRSHASEVEERILKLFGVKEVTGKGSSLKFCLVAEGKADVYFRKNPTMEWDTAAGQAIVERAGGTVLDKHNQRFSYNKEVLRNGSFLCLGYDRTELEWNNFD